MEAPELYLLAVNGEIKKMANLTDDMFKTYTEAFARNDIDINKIVQDLKKKEDYADQMQEQLTNVCVKAQKENMVASSSVSTFLRVIDELESVTDSIFNLIKLTQQRLEQKLTYTQEEEQEIRSLIDLVSSFISFISDHVDKGLKKVDLETAQTYERSINKQHKTLSERIHSRLGKGADDVALELIMLEIERNLEHIGDYLINIAECYHNVTKHTPLPSSITK